MLTKPKPPFKPELLAPAGSFDSALAAIQYGADALYLGLSAFSARADANNFTLADLTRLTAYARSLNPIRRIYITLNTLIKDSELPQLIQTLADLVPLQPDGLIVHDLGIAHLVRRHFPSLPLHASTQMAVHNLAGAQQLRQLGFTRVVLARELTIPEIAAITRDCGIEVEVFIHGALCYSISGLCLFSSQTSGRSGNRGRCAYCCREPFTTTHSTGRSFPFSMRDLALLPALNQLCRAGVHSLKIEGRMKSPLYVACVTNLYRQKLDGNLTPAREAELTQELQTIFSRPWTTLYAHDTNAAPDSIIDPISIGHRGTQIGTLKAISRDRQGTRWLHFHSNRPLEKHDGIQIETPDGGKPFGCAINQLRPARTRQAVISTPANTEVEVALPDNTDLPYLPPGAPIFCSASQAVRRHYTLNALRDSELPGLHPVDFTLSLAPHAITATATLTNQPTISATTTLSTQLDPSRQPEKSHAAATRAFSRTGTTNWRFNQLTLHDPHSLFAPLSILNDLRRQLLDTLDQHWHQQRQTHTLSVLEHWGLSPTDPTQSEPLLPSTPPELTLKMRLNETPPPPDLLQNFSSIVLQLDHSQPQTIRAQLDAWSAAAPTTAPITLALPLMNRQHELPPLLATIETLSNTGWQLWEIADLATAHLLAQQGITPYSADWPLYALNRSALTAVATLGIKRLVLSPEIDLPTLQDLLACSATNTLQNPPLPILELIAFQHTPLYISDTPPCFNTPDQPHLTATPATPMRMTNRRGTEFHLLQLDNRWITTATTPYYTAAATTHLPLTHQRLDLTWSPLNTLTTPLIHALHHRIPLPHTHTANLPRPLL